ncbi:MAG: Verru_Chthon cassette protein A [Verrucomicrobiales bacterium]
MKIAEKLQRAKAFSKDRKGIALLTVLTVMSLTTIMVLTFFSLATSEHRASNTYSHGIQAQQVAEQAVNMVIAQIREATTVGTSRAWASQPGAVRVWNQGGELDWIYKLYSDDVMKSRNASEIGDDFADIEDWSSRPAHFVDLNEPVIRGDKVYYPVVHPAAANYPKWPKSLGDDSDGVEGFSYNKYPNASLSDEGEFGAKAAVIAKAVDGHAAMPVRWLYQLADGTIGVLNDSSGGGGTEAYEFVTVSGGGEPSANNPMVARFAFWADDETSKLNLNTHAGGLAWDVPKAGGGMDMSMGRYQPAQHEWQRYPGHPATTHLSPALAPGVLDIVNDRDAMEMLYEVVPRVVGGGSKSGTRLLDTRDPAEENGLVADTEPLFPSVDDMIMRSDREPHEFPDAKGRPIPDDELSEYLERSKFFLTVTSRAPETNMFNLPRVAIWPIHNTSYGAGGGGDYTKYLTPFDRLIHYCASMGESGGGDYPRNEYVFKREKADSATHDYEQIPSNQTLYRYLDGLMSRDIPGYGGGSFSDKYGSSQQKQILTQIFDYIRSTNLHDDTLYSENFKDAFQETNTSEHLTFTNPRDGTPNNLGFGHKGHGQVTPIQIEETKGMGRFFTLSGADIMVACVGAPRGEGPGHPRYPGYTEYIPNAPNQLRDRGSEIAYTNLPPLPASLDVESREPKSEWPAWLSAAEVSSPEEFAAAWDPANWNWQLAFLDDRYKDNVLSNPTEAKYNRDLISKASSDTMRLGLGEKLVQASFLFNLFSPSIGWGGINPDMEIHISKTSGMTFPGADGTEEFEFLGFSGQGANPEGPETYVWATNWVKPHREGGVRAWGGLLPFTFAMQARDTLAESADGLTARAGVWWQLWQDRSTTSPGIRSRLTPIDRGYDKIEDALGRVERDVGGDLDKVAQAYRYDLVTVPFKVNSTSRVAFGGGEVKFEIYDGGEYAENSYRDDAAAPSLVQEIDLEFPPFKFETSQVTVAAGRPGHVNEFGNLGSDSTSVLEHASVTADPANPWDSPVHSVRMRGGPWGNSNPNPATKYDEANPKGVNVRGRMGEAALRWNGLYLHGGDIVQSVAITHGDARVVASRKRITVDEPYFQKHRKWDSAPRAHSLTNADGVGMAGFNPASDKEYLIIPDLPKSRQGNTEPYNNRIPLAFATDRSEDVQLYGDFDNGAGTMIDGPYINKPDEGNTHALKTKFTQEVVHYWERRRNFGEFPYFSHPEKAEAGGPAYFSPNRIVSGPGMFGSLPTGGEDNKPWQTLLFRPDVEGNGYDSHPGAEDPPDHLVMDLFWMPIVEPYAISEPLSTAGKVNMNYEMAPFLHIERNTALRGVFRSEFMLTVPSDLHGDYKHGRGRGRGYHWRDRPRGGFIQNFRLRTAIVEDKTLELFRNRFNLGSEIFKSASEICEMHLMPEEVSTRLGMGSRGSMGTYTPTVEQMESGEYWRDHSLVGDNSRERPYTNIHNRLTTKSNTFQVHFRAQVIKQARRDDDGGYSEWRPETDTVQAEYRGSSIVERYVDPNDPDIPNFAETGVDSPVTLDDFYRFRVVNPKRFAP